MARFVSLVGESPADIAIASRLCRDIGVVVVGTYPTDGKGRLDRALRGYNAAARFSNWVVLRDLDHDARCGPELAARLLPRPAKRMTFRVAVRSVESWLIADSKELAGFLRVRLANIPRDPDSLERPKRALVDIAQRSRSRAVVAEMVPPHGHGEVGPGYNLRLIEFARSYWDPTRAAKSSDSLRRCIRALRCITP